MAIKTKWHTANTIFYQCAHCVSFLKITRVNVTSQFQTSWAILSKFIETKIWPSLGFDEYQQYQQHIATATYAASFIIKMGRIVIFLLHPIIIHVHK